MRFLLIRAAIVICMLGGTGEGLFGQGSLTPPGPPGPTMKTLDEIASAASGDVRTVVNATTTPGDPSNTYIINQPGSYYLAGNLNASGGKNGISIRADGVSLDLNGFALIGEATGGGVGITVPAVQNNVSIRNGTIRLWQANGISGVNAANSVLEKLRVSNNAADGAQIGVDSAVRDCVFSNNAGRGLVSVDRLLVSGCVSDANVLGGMVLGSEVTVIDCLITRGTGANPALVVIDRSLISRCTVTKNAATGIQTGQAASVTSCNMGGNTGAGIKVGLASSVRDCTLRANGAEAILVLASECQIVENMCDGNGFGTLTYAILVNGVSSRVEGNTCVNGQGGIAAGANNLVVRNSARGNLKNYNFIGTQAGIAPVVDVSAGNVPGATSPWANFAF